MANTNASRQNSTLNPKRRSSFLAHAVIWIVAIAAGTAFSKFVYPQLVTPGRESMADRIKKYEAAWAEAFKRVAANPPPPVEEVVQQAPWGQQSSLQVKLDAIYKTNHPEYIKKANALYAEIEKTFRNEWQERYDDFADTPTAEEFLKAVHEHHHAELKKHLEPIDADLKRKLPRWKLALDSFSGYCVLRSREFRERVKKDEIMLHLADDGGDYKKRIEGLESGEVHMAAITLDALINNSALFNSPPAAVVMVLDETRGADAMVAYSDTFKKIDDLNRSDLEIVLTPDSPSDMLARLVRTEFKLPKLLGDCTVKANGAEEVYKQFLEGEPGKPRTYVLWEPFVTKALKDPRAHVLIDSASFRGYIVDVLVANKKFLAEHKDEVEKVVRAYLETAAEFQKSPDRLTSLVLEDAHRLADPQKHTEQLSRQEAQRAVNGIWWKTTQENYGHFALLTGDEAKQHQPLEEMIKNIGQVLVKTNAINKTKAPKPTQLFDKEICAKLHASQFNPGPGTTVVSTAPLPPVPRDSPEFWARLKRVGELEVQPISFARGQAKILELSEPTLIELSEKLKTTPLFYVEIRAYVASDTPEDKELAQARADEVAKWLREKGGIVAPRMKALAVKATPSEGMKGTVGFVVLEEPKNP